ncbi:ATP-dependent DNA helicase [Prochlorococcus sp. MIT 1300]|uniref:ATP-dependent DNA helicase n=1 Tax=Prochlorococcus sp. MIT 1300 TaxID=3096218 RepID=UPI002A74C719|nr:AAA family ATPase [Prochlorococcus sp. MIT 1300]
MKNNEGESLSDNLKGEVYKVLIRKIPPKHHSEHLEDLVNALMNAVSRGELGISFNGEIPLIEPKATGWPEAHIEALRKSGWLNGNNPPMVITNQTLRWHRWHIEISNIINCLKAKVELKESTLDNISLENCPAENSRLNREQRKAILAISNEKLILLSGGPGTGKTTTIVGMLERAFFSKKQLRVALAAPTGKAARRLQDALQKGINELPIEMQENLFGLKCNTLHRLLEAKKNSFGKNNLDQLPIDLLVVDEMSMVDISLLQALLAALPIKARLVLVGDPNQLPPVSGGSIWDELLESELRQNFPTCVIHLKEVHRNRGAIAKCSKVLIEKGLKDFTRELCRTTKSENIELHTAKPGYIPSLITKHLKSHCKKLSDLALNLDFQPDIHEYKSHSNVNAELLINTLNQLMILSPKRKGLWGVNEIHQSILGPTWNEGPAQWPVGTPVICGENQPELDLANGDIGVIIKTGMGKRLLFKVINNEGDSFIKLFHPARLKSVEPSLSITIHKSQGSEASQVIILLPEYLINNDSAYNTKKVPNYQEKLLYTAITRATQKVDLFLPDTISLDKFK